MGITSHLPPKLSKHSGGLGITPCKGLKRVEIVSPDICKDNSNNGKTKCRLFRFTPVTSTPMVHVMETGPFLAVEVDALQQKWTNMFPYTILLPAKNTLFMNPQGSTLKGHSSNQGA